MALTQAQVTANLGAGWTLGTGTTVTSGNQDQFAIQADSSCGLVTDAQAMSSLGAGYYAPKIGWIVYDVTKSDGSVDQIWHNDDGAGNITNYNLSDCVGLMSSDGAGGGGGYIITKKSSSLGGWLLLGGLAVGAIYVLGKGKKKSPRSSRRKK